MLRQQDEQEIASSASSRRSQHSRPASQNRIQNWVDDVARVAHGVGGLLPGNTVIVNERDFDPNVIVANEGHASSTPVRTPLPNTASGLVQPAPVRLRLNDKSRELAFVPPTTGSIEIGETDEDESKDIGAIGGSNRKRISPALSFVDVVGPLDDLLNKPAEMQSKTGTIPKLKTHVTYEQWRSRTTNLEMEKEHLKQNDIRRQRELELVNQLNRLEMQKDDGELRNLELIQQMKEHEQEKERIIQQKQRECIELEQQMHRQSQEHGNLSEQQQKELEHLRCVEREYRNYTQNQENRVKHPASMTVNRGD